MSSTRDALCASDPVDRTSIAGSGGGSASCGRTGSSSNNGALTDASGNRRAPGAEVPSMDPLTALTQTRVYLCFVGGEDSGSASLRRRSDGSEPPRLESRCTEGSGANGANRGMSRERDLCASQTLSSAGSDSAVKEELRKRRLSYSLESENANAMPRGKGGSSPSSQLASQELPLAERTIAKLKVASSTKLKRAFARLPVERLGSYLREEDDAFFNAPATSPRKHTDTSKDWWLVGKHWCVFYFKKQRLDPERTPVEYNMQTSDPSNPVVITVRSAKSEGARRASNSKASSVVRDDEPVLFRHIPWAVAPVEDAQLPQQRSHSTTPVSTPRKSRSLTDSSRRAYDKRGAEYVSFTPPPPLFRSTSPAARHESGDLNDASQKSITTSASKKDSARLKSNVPIVQSELVRLASAPISLDSGEASSPADRNTTMKGGSSTSASKMKGLSIPLPPKRSTQTQHAQLTTCNTLSTTSSTEKAPREGEISGAARNLNGELRRCTSSKAREKKAIESQALVRTPSANSTNCNFRRTSSAHVDPEHTTPPFVVGSATPRMTFEERERSLQLREQELQRTQQARDASRRRCRQSAEQRTPSPRKGGAPTPHARESNHSPSANCLALQPKRTSGSAEPRKVAKRPTSARAPLHRRARSTMSSSPQAVPQPANHQERGVSQKRAAMPLRRYASSSSTLTDASSKNSQSAAAAAAAHPPPRVQHVTKSHRPPPRPTKPGPPKTQLMHELSELRSRFDTTVEQQAELQKQAAIMMRAIASLETENAQLSDLTKQLSNAALARAAGARAMHENTEDVSGAPGERTDDPYANRRQVSSPSPHVPRHLANSPMQPPQRAYTQSPLRLSSQQDRSGCSGLVEEDDFIPNTTHMEDTPKCETERSKRNSHSDSSVAMHSEGTRNPENGNGAMQLPAAPFHEESKAGASNPNGLPHVLTSIVPTDADHQHFADYTAQHQKYSASQLSPGETSLDSASHSISSRSRGVHASAKRSLDDVRSETGSITSYQTDRLLESSIDTWSPANPACISPYYRGATEWRARRRPMATDYTRGPYSFKYDTGGRMPGNASASKDIDASFEERYGQQLRDSGPPPEVLPIGDEWEEASVGPNAETRRLGDGDVVSTPQRPSMQSDGGSVVDQMRACSSPPSDDDEEGPTPSPQPLAIPMQSRHANQLSPVSRAESGTSMPVEYPSSRACDDENKFFRQTAPAVCNERGSDLGDSTHKKPWKRQGSESNPRDSADSLKMSGAHMFTTTFSSIPKDEILDEPRYTSMSPSRADGLDDMESDRSFTSSTSSVFARQVRNEMNRLRAHLTSNHIGTSGKEEVAWKAQKGDKGSPQHKPAFESANHSAERPFTGSLDSPVKGTEERRRRHRRGHSDPNTTLSPEAVVSTKTQLRTISNERLSSESTGATVGKESHETAEGKHKGESEHYPDSRSTCSIEYSSSKDTSDSEKQRELMYLVDELSSYNAELEKDMRTLARKLQHFVTERCQRHPSQPTPQIALPERE